MSSNGSRLTPELVEGDRVTVNRGLSKRICEHVCIVEKVCIRQIWEKSPVDIIVSCSENCRDYICYKVPITSVEKTPISCSSRNSSKIISCTLEASSEVDVTGEVDVTELYSSSMSSRRIKHRLDDDDDNDHRPTLFPFSESFERASFILNYAYMTVYIRNIEYEKIYNKDANLIVEVEEIIGSIADEALTFNQPSPFCDRVKDIGRKCFKEVYYSGSKKIVGSRSSASSSSRTAFSTMEPVFINDLVNRLGITSSSKFLDIGSGIGHMCLMISLMTNCCCTGVEINPELHTKAEFLKGIVCEVMCDLEFDVAGVVDNVKLVNGDILEERAEIANANKIFFNNAGGWYCPGKSDTAVDIQREILNVMTDCEIGTDIVTIDALIGNDWLKATRFYAPAGSCLWNEDEHECYRYRVLKKQWKCTKCEKRNSFYLDCCQNCSKVRRAKRDVK